MVKRLLLIILIWMSLLGTQAQNAPNRALVLSVQAGELAAGELVLPTGTVFIAFADADAGRYARVDSSGLALFVPPGSAQESLYTASPFFDGFLAPTAQENRLRVREAQLSPDGSMLAFRIENDMQPEISDGVWFWQPLQQLATDPSYQLLRHCPPCGQVNAQASDNWRTTHIDWAPDGSAILVGLELRSEGRRALHIAYPIRDIENRQAITAPQVLRYTYGHWSPDAQRLVVSGAGPDGSLVVGTIARDGSDARLTPADSIGLAWVQDAIIAPDSGQLRMLGAQQPNAPLQILDAHGQALTQPIGAGLPERVVWSPDRSAVLLRIGGSQYVAQVDGTITDITALVGDAQAVNWVTGPLPGTASRQELPTPQVSAAPPTTSALPATLPPPQTAYQVGQLMQISVAGQALYAEPVPDADVVTLLGPGSALILTAGPLTDGVTVWWRVQTLEFSGWLPETRDGVLVFQPGR